MVKHDILYGAKLNYDSSNGRYYLFIEIGPSDVMIQKDESSQPEKVKAWRFIGEGFHPRDIAGKTLKYPFPLGLRNEDGTAFDIEIFAQSTLAMAPVKDEFKSIIDIVPSEEVKFTDEDMGAIREFLIPYNAKGKIYSEEDMKQVRREVAQKIISFSDSSDHEASEIADIFTAHIIDVKVKKMNDFRPEPQVVKEAEPQVELDQPAEQIEVVESKEAEVKPKKVKKETKPKEPKAKKEPKPKKAKAKKETTEV